MMNAFELLQLCANLMTMVKWSGGLNPFANRGCAYFVDLLFPVKFRLNMDGWMFFDDQNMS